MPSTADTTIGTPHPRVTSIFFAFSAVSLTTSTSETCSHNNMPMTTITIVVSRNPEATRPN